MTTEKTEKTDLLKFYRSEIKFESELLSNRLNSFISSQSFLLIAYGGSMSGLIGHWNRPFALAFPPVLALLALSLSCQAMPGIKASFAVIDEWRRKQNALCADDPDLALYSLSPGSALTEWQRQGSIFAKHAPPLFIAAWCYLILLPIFLYLRN